MTRLASKSRLSRRLEKQSRKNFFLSILGIIIVFFLVIKFGIPFLVNFSLLISGINNSNLPIHRSTRSFLAAPTLSSQFTATNSAVMEFSGNSEPEADIEIYHNERLIDITQSNKNGEFLFKITLDPGENQIKVRAKKENKESNYSNALTVIFNNKPPKLEVNSPLDGQAFPKYQEVITVSGNTDENVRITINGFWAIIDENERFKYDLKLKEGENTIRIEAIDGSGNKAVKEIKVTRSQ